MFTVVTLKGNIIESIDNITNEQLTEISVILNNIIKCYHTIDHYVLDNMIALVDKNTSTITYQCEYSTSTGRQVFTLRSNHFNVTHVTSSTLHFMLSEASEISVLKDGAIVQTNKRLLQHVNYGQYVENRTVLKALNVSCANYDPDVNSITLNARVGTIPIISKEFSSNTGHPSQLMEENMVFVARNKLMELEEYFNARIWAKIGQLAESNEVDQSTLDLIINRANCIVLNSEQYVMYHPRTFEKCSTWDKVKLIDKGVFHNITTLLDMIL